MFKGGIRSIKYVFSEIFRTNISLLYIYLPFVIISAFEPYIFTYYSKFILNAIEKNKSYYDMVIMTLIAFASAAIIGFLKKTLENLKTPQVIKSTIAIKRKITEINLITDYSNIENPFYLNKQEKVQNTLNNVSKGFQGVIHSTFALLESTISIIIYFFIMRKFNYWIIFLIGIISILNFIIFNRARKYEYDKNGDLTFYRRKSNYFFNIICDFSYGKDIRIFGFAKTIFHHFTTAKSDEINVIKSIKFKYLKVNFISEILNAIVNLVLYGYFVCLFIEEKISIGNFSLLILATNQTISMIRKFLEQFSNIAEQSFYIDELKEFMTYGTNNNNDSHRNLEKDLQYIIEVRNIYFRYLGSEKYIFENFSLKIAKGEKLALIGYNGAGKSTLVKLICGLLYPEKGQILINGVETKKMQKEECYKLFSTVFQDICIFAFSVAENITLNENDIDFKKVDECLEKAGLSSKIHILKDSVNTSMSKVLDAEGIELSGGEKQKLVHARAFYKDGDITILDEPTAAMDPLAEYELYNNFNNISFNKTSLYISHRLSFAKFCDKIVFLEHGKIIEYGTHDELISQNNAYTRFYRLQAQYYRDDNVIDRGFNAFEEKYD